MKYKILDIKQRSKQTGETSFKPIIKVWYVSDKGYKGSIEMNKKGFSAEKVIEEIEKELSEVEKLKT